MTYKIKTPLLQRVANGLMGIFDDAIEGDADIAQGRLAVAAGSNVRLAVATDLKVRLNTPRLESIEKKED